VKLRLKLPKSDTLPAAEREYWRRIREMTPEQRLRKVFDMIAAGRAMTDAAVRRQHPDADERTVKRLVFERWYRRDFTREQLLAWEKRLGLLDEEPRA
jgi:hypothetical protein